MHTNNETGQGKGGQYTFDRVFRLFVALCGLAGLIWLTSYLSDVLVPFAVALVAAYLINPLVLQVQKLVKKRWAAVLISLGITVLVLVLLWVSLAPAISGEVKRAGSLVSKMMEDNKYSQKAAEYLPEDFWQAVADLIERPEVKELVSINSLSSLASVIARRVLPGLWGLITTAGSLLVGITGLFLILLYLVFLLLEFPRIQEGWPTLLPHRYREAALEFAGEAEHALATYFRGQAAVACVVGVLFALGFWIIEMPLGIILGLFVGLLNMVPYLQLMALVPAILLGSLHVIETGMNFWGYMGMIGGVFAVVQIIQDAFLVPRIMGKATGLNPAVILLALSIWGKLLGFLGLLLAIPLTLLLWTYYQRYLNKTRNSEGWLEQG